MKCNESKKDTVLGYISKFERDTVATFYTLWYSQYVISRQNRNIVLCYTVKNFKATVIYSALNKLICYTWSSILMYTT